LGESQNQLCFGGENEEEFFRIERPLHQVFFGRENGEYFFGIERSLNQVFFGRENEEIIFLNREVFLAEKM
jgi:hypothetical protein